MDIREKTIIAGPCSAESRRQVIAAATALHDYGIEIFRAGLWKPRSRYGCFEGVGKEGIPWLKEARELTGMKIATEVANPQHVELCLEAGFDMLWIGARTTSNPFAIQELADALKGTDVPLLVKNPLSPDLDLWLGAIDRLAHAGVGDISAVHRGFHTFLKTQYRNNPHWEMAIELRNRRPELPIICDPSHIGGARELVLPLAQFAMDLNFDGLMIESHPDPACALSDAAQQLTPGELASVLQDIKVRHKSQRDETLDLYRAMIDECDDSLLEILKRRMEISDKIGEYKRENAISVFQPERYNDILHRRMAQAEKAGMNPKFIKRVYDAIHAESIARQTD